VRARPFEELAWLQRVTRGVCTLRADSGNAAQRATSHDEHHLRTALKQPLDVRRADGTDVHRTIP
jgi:hypothetical protein